MQPHNYTHCAETCNTYTEHTRVRIILHILVSLKGTKVPPHVTKNIMEAFRMKKLKMWSVTHKTKLSLFSSSMLSNKTDFPEGLDKQYTIPVGFHSTIN